MGLIWSAIVGLVVGAVAKFFMPGEQGGGIIVTMILGILGSVVATWIGQAIGLYPPGANAGFIASVLGAILLLWIYGLIRKKS
ncbi:MAG: GlsB/YeaQ/YmgE family stress response membrane protein [Limnobacter sp.]|nr:GlsB/YeaQ/YmgE family stress response membrane protein [Limnobacter sp.]